MHTIEVSGHSDDTFDWGLDDHDDCAAGTLRAVALRCGDEGMIVTGQYVLANGCWIIGIAPLDEDVPLPNWPMRWYLNDRGYSPVLELKVPFGTVGKLISQ